MKTRILGRTQLKISEIGYGAWAIGGGMWGKSNDDLSLDALRKALDLGVNFVDTAAVYGDGHSEKLVGKIYRETGRKFIVASKIPPKDWNWPPVKVSPIKNTFPASWVRENTEKSLMNLGVDCIDLHQIHVWSPNWVKESEWYETMVKLREEGKIRFIGVSLNDHEPDQALELVRSGMADTVQVIYNIFDQSPEDHLFPQCRENGVGVIARVPLDEGSLTGKFTKDTKFSSDDWRKDYFTPDVLKETVKRVDHVKRAVGEDFPSLATGALKFCLSSPDVSTVIPGIRTPRQAEQNCGASDGEPLKDSVIDELRRHRWVRK